MLKMQRTEQRTKTGAKMVFGETGNSTLHMIHLIESATPNPVTTLYFKILDV
jgi:hypothetical protein